MDIEDKIKQLEDELQKTLENTPLVVKSVTKTKKGNDRVRTNHTTIISQYTKKINSLRKYGVEDFHQSEDYKQKMKESHNTKEYKANMNNALKKKWADPDFKDKMSKMRKEIYNTEEYKQKRSIISKNRSAEVNEKISQGLRKAPRRVTLESLQATYPNHKIISYHNPEVDVICPECGNIFTTWYKNLSYKTTCNDCSFANEAKWYTTEDIQSKCPDIKITGEYKGILVPLEWVCNTCGYKGITAPTYLVHGIRGCKCTPKSKPELEIVEYIQSIEKGTVLHNTRTVIPPYELDIYIPDKKVAIEYNGTYWHSSLYKDKYYHISKYKECASKGIRLIQIWEYEWKDIRKQEILKSVIKSALGLSENKINARECKLEVKESKEVQEFIGQNNLAGERNGEKAFCLIYEGEIVQCMLVGKSTFYKKGYKDTGKPPYEIIRAATKKNTQVRGGTSRLLKHIEEYANGRPLLYFVELDHFNGSGLENRDKWELIKIQPGIKVWWVKDQKVTNRDSYNHKYFKEQEALGKAILIYTTGTAKYVYNPDKDIASSK